MKNPLCPYYSRCLDQAAKSDDPDFDCTGCRYQREAADLPCSDIEGDILLLWAIFKPNLYKEVREVERAERMQGVGSAKSQREAARQCGIESREGKPKWPKVGQRNQNQRLNPKSKKSNVPKMEHSEVVPEKALAGKAVAVSTTFSHASI